jgi:hypothetical protein
MNVVEGDTVLVEHVENSGESFFLRLQAYVQGVDSGGDLMVVGAEMDLEEPHTDEAHTNIAADEAFIAPVEDMVGHLLERNVRAAGAAEGKTVVVKHVARQAGREDALAALPTGRVTGAAVDMFLTSGLSIDGAAHAFPGERGAFMDDVAVQVVLEVSGPLIAKRAVDHACGHAFHKQKVHLVDIVPVHLGGVHGLGARKASDGFLSLGGGLVELKIFIGAPHADAQVRVARFLGPPIGHGAREADGSNRDDQQVATDTTIHVEALGGIGRGGGGIGNRVHQMYLIMQN